MRKNHKQLFLLVGKLFRNQYFFLSFCLVGGLILGFIWGALDHPVAEAAATKDNIWEYLEENAPLHGLDPRFVYAIAMAESSLKPTADSGYAKGMMQLSEIAWEEVSDTSYRFAYDWHVNLDVGMDYLVFLKQFLKENNSFSYPLLAACYRYGPYKVRDESFNISRLPAPHNKIYQELFAGNIAPVKTP